MQVLFCRSTPFVSHDSESIIKNNKWMMEHMWRRMRSSSKNASLTTGCIKWEFNQDEEISTPGHDNQSIALLQLNLTDSSSPKYDRHFFSFFCHWDSMERTNHPPIGAIYSHHQQVANTFSMAFRSILAPTVHLLIEDLFPKSNWI